MLLEMTLLGLEGTRWFLSIGFFEAASTRLGTTALALLGFTADLTLILLSPPRLAADMELDEAANMLQNMWRNRKARALIRVLLAACWEKVLQEESGSFYYFNKVTHLAHHT